MTEDQDEELVIGDGDLAGESLLAAYSSSATDRLQPTSSKTAKDSKGRGRPPRMPEHSERSGQNDAPKGAQRPPSRTRPRTPFEFVQQQSEKIQQAPKVIPPPQVSPKALQKASAYKGSNVEYVHFDSTNLTVNAAPRNTFRHFPRAQK